MVKRYDIISYTQSEAERLGSVWLDEAGRLTCDSESLREAFTREGIAVPPGELVYPQDGLRFFEALPFAQSGLIKIEGPDEVPSAQGDPF